MKSIILLSVMMAIISCNSNKDKESNISPKIEVVRDSSVSDSQQTFNPETKLYVWKAEYNYTKVLNPALSPTIRNADSLIKGLNELYENVLLQKEKISGDTIFTYITNSQYLTNQMGSTGAEVYIADVVLNLAEVSGIKYISINMKEGSHAQSGIWTKQNFEKYKTVKE